MTEPERRGDVAFEVSASTLAWVATGAVFVVMRFAGFLSIPVGGPELASLSGAWQAHAGNEDGRFAASLFQALTAWSFEFTSSETPARVLALFASVSVPFALYRLRDHIGEAAALAALLLLAFDPVSILLGSTAWAGAFDVALILWLWVFTLEERRPPWLAGVAGFALATAGPLVLPFVVAYAAIRLAKQDYPSRETGLWLAGGVLLGGAVAAAQFGFGFHDPVLPPIMLFTQGFEDGWSSETTRYLTVLYSAPILVLAAAAAVYRAYVCWSEQDWPEFDVLALTTLAVSLAWVALAGGSQDPVPLGAAALAGTLVLGRELPGALERLRTADWLYAAPILLGMTAAALIAEAYVVDWARLDRVGSDRDKVIVTGLVVAIVAAVGVLGSNRRLAPSLLAVPAIVAAVPLFSGAFGVAFGGQNEPLPSPISAVQGREIRDIAVRAREESGGQIAVHSDFEDEFTWPFRDSAEVVLTSRVPEDAIVVVWPESEAPPEGFAVLDGRWSLQEERFGPSGGFLDYLRWLTKRNSLRNSAVPVAVYLRTTP